VSLMVVFLVVDVGDRAIALFAAEGDYAVAALPCKGGGIGHGVLVEVVTAAAFDVFDEISDGDRGWNGDDEVNVIGNATDRLDNATEGISFAVNVGIEQGFAIGRDQGEAVFCGPNEMVMGTPINVHGWGVVRDWF
jgi:hypothetical protein